MSGINISSRTVVAFLVCGRCSERWESEVYDAQRHVRSGLVHVEACQPAFKIGWRVYAGQRAYHAYCPGCAPTVPMRLLHPMGADRG